MGRKQLSIELRLWIQQNVPEFPSGMSGQIRKV